MLKNSINEKLLHLRKPQCTKVRLHGRNGKKAAIMK